MAHGVSTVRYPIPERIFDYVSTVRSATAGTCDEAKFGGALLDHVVGEGEERRGHGDAQRLRGLDVDGEREFGRLYDRQVTGIRTTLL